LHVQLVMAVAPAALNAWNGQSVHAPSPGSLLKVPAAQAMQLPSCCVSPASQMQSPARVVPGVLVVKRGHVAQAALPDTFLYVPAAHAVQLPPPGPV
tara:strand:+ start:2463 stop:2753 length:291 start_codon:yes stop_codon:yes gene_type:complete